MESAPCVREGGGGGWGLFLLSASRLSDKSFEIDNKKRDWRRDGWARRPCSSRLQPHELFFRVFQASKAKPEAGVERRGGVKSKDFDQIDEKPWRSSVTSKIQQNASMSESVIELWLLLFSRVPCLSKRIPFSYKYGSQWQWTDCQLH